MRSRSLAVVAAGLLAWPCAAQESPNPKAEVLPPPKADALAPAVPPGCACVEQHKTTYELHWVERQVPCTVTTMETREVSTPCVRPTLKLEFQTEQRVKTEMILQPREILKEVTCCTKKPIASVDPCTGCPTIVFEPVTETKVVKEIVYDLVPQEKVYTVQTGLLVPTEEAVVRKSLVLDVRTDSVLRKERIGVLVPCEITERKFIPPPPQPACPPPGCAK